MTDIEFDVGDGTLLAMAGGRRRDKARATMWCWSSADLDPLPWNTTGFMYKEVFEQIGCQRHVSIRQLVELLDCLLIRWLKGVEERERRRRRGQWTSVNVPPDQRWSAILLLAAVHSIWVFLVEDQSVVTRANVPIEAKRVLCHKCVLLSV